MTEPPPSPDSPASRPGRPKGWRKPVLAPSTASINRPPSKSDPVALWLSPDLATGFDAAGCQTIDLLCQLIEREGPSWYRGIEGVGKAGAISVQDWIQLQAPAIPPLDLSGPAWRRTAPPFPAEKAQSGSQRQGSSASDDSALSRDLAVILTARWEPVAEAVNRASGPNAMGVRHDVEAVERWLASYESAEKRRTHQAYRREIVRFLLWCRCEAGVDLAAVTLEHAQAFQRFLADIPARYITTLRVSVQDDRWRPWRGQLDQRSQNYTLQVVAQCFSELHANGYLRFNPFASLKRKASAARVMDTSRSLSDDDLKWVHEHLANMLPNVDQDIEQLDLYQMQQLALARRTRMVLHVLLATGMRLSELANATFASLRKARVDGKECSEIYAIEIVGKGGKPRDILLRGGLVSMVRQHHSDVVALLIRAGGESAEDRLAKMRLRPPLVCAIVAPPGSKSRAIDDDSEMAGDNLALSWMALYKTLKSFFRGATRQQIKAAERALHSVRSAGSDPVEVAKAEQAAMKWRRRAKMSTHWLRHTFAHQVLRSNADDGGLKLAQELLGHANISTTAEYLKQDETARVRAIEKLRTWGG